MLPYYDRDPRNQRVPRPGIGQPLALLGIYSMLAWVLCALIWVTAITPLLDWLATPLATLVSR